MTIEESHGIIRRIIAEVEKVVVGKRDAIMLLLTAMLAGSHALIEDVPGVGKTTLAKSLCKASGLEFKYAQFTPDVTASDITGFNMYNRDKGVFEYRQGLCNCNILVADEINRTPPKTQSALLEAMQERRVSIDGVQYGLPMPFMVVATQNSVGSVGTFPLPEAQLDRFLVRINVGYPTPDQEAAMLASRLVGDPVENIQAVCTRDDIVHCIELVKHINVDARILRYIVDLVGSTRDQRTFALGGSPRSGLMLMKASQARAFLCARDYVIPEDPAAMMPFVLEHRIKLNQGAELKGTTEGDALRAVMKRVKPPVIADSNTSGATALR